MLDPDKTVGEVGERGLVRHLISRLPAGPGVRIGPGDDAAAVETGELTLVTSDGFVEGRHFHRDWAPPRLIGRKLLTVNLSDVAAMSGAPRFAIVNLFLPSETTVAFVDGLYDGLLERAAETGVSVIGGNIGSTTGPMVLDVTLLGIGDALLMRDGAKPGDLLVCTGYLGRRHRVAAAGSAPGRRRRADRDRSDPNSAPSVHHCACARNSTPAPPPPSGRARWPSMPTRARGDGPLRRASSSDLLSMCEASRVFAIVDAGVKIPLDPVQKSAWARAWDATRPIALHGARTTSCCWPWPPESLEGARATWRSCGHATRRDRRAFEGPPAISPSSVASV